MKKLTLFFAIALSFCGFSQNKHAIVNPSGMPERGCGTVEYLRQEVKENPRVLEIRRQIEEQTEQFIQSQGSHRSSQVVINIPVVFHVVYNTSAENIPDYRLLDQLQVLNEDFNKLNIDTGNVPAVWKSIAADCQINFCLAQRDPFGNPTTGITRTSTSVTSFTTNNKVKYTSQGGEDAWDRDRYLNLWVCDLGSTLLGYAQFPGGTAATDGVVFHYLYTGNNTATFPYDKGRTATHEIGHWLNLNHIWGDDSGACTGTDNVADTPNQASEHYGCFTPGSVQTDACATSAPGTMWQNYMDYTDDACMYMFTNGQKARIQALFTAGGARASLVTSNGCTPVAALDASIAAIAQPDGATCNLTGSPVVTLHNNGTSILTSATISYNIDGGSNTIYNWNGSLVSGSSISVTLPAYTSVAGIHTLNVFTSSPNGGIDQLTVNDTYSKSFTLIAAAAPLTLPFTEGFQSTTFPPAGWTKVDPNSNNTWTRVTTAGGFGTSTASAKMDNYTGNINIGSQTDELITPRIDLSNANSTLSLTFNVAYVRYSNAYTDTLLVEVSTDCGTTWQTTYLKGGSQLATKATDQTTAFTPTSAQWRTETVSMSSYAGISSALIRFKNYSGSGNNIYIDDINLSFNAVAPVADFSAASTTVCEGNNIVFTDLSTNTPTSWSWSVTGPSTQSSNIQNPNFTFNTAGTYTISLTSGNGTGTDTQIKNSYITVNPIPAAPTVTTPLNYCQNASSSSLTAGGSNLLWYSSSAGGTGTATAPAPSTSSTGTTTYYVSQTSSSCESSRASIDVAVNPIPTSPVVFSPVTYCQNSVADTLTATGTNLLWYTASTGGTGSVSSPSPSTVSPGTTTYYVSRDSGSCESLRSAIDVVVNPTPNAPAVTTPIIYCVNAPASPLSAPGSNLLWYSSSTGGSGSATAPIPSTATAGTTTYYVSETTGSCESARSAIDVVVNSSLSAPTVATPVAYCENATADSLSAGGTGLLWYTSSSGGTGSSIAPTPSTAITGTSTFYVSQTSGTCESPRSSIDVVVDPTPASPSVSTPVNYCENGSAAPLSVPGSNLLWYSNSSGGSGTSIAPTPTTSIPGTITYYVSQTVGSCESLRSSIEVITNATPAIPTVASPVIYCQNDPASALSASGSNLLWYSTPTGGTGSLVVPTPGTAVSDTTTYYVTQTLNGCEGPAAQIDVVINPLPVADFTFSSSNGLATFTNTSADATGFLWNFGDGSSSGALDTTHAYASPGNYTVTLIADNSCGSDTVSQTVNIAITGLNSVTSETSWIISPNPSQGVFFVTCPASIKTITFSVYNSIGKLIKVINYDGSLTKIDLTDNANGFYYLVGKMSNKTITHKISIMH